MSYISDVIMEPQFGNISICPTINYYDEYQCLTVRNKNCYIIECFKRINNNIRYPYIYYNHYDKKLKELNEENKEASKITIYAFYDNKPDERVRFFKCKFDSIKHLDLNIKSYSNEGKTVSFKSIIVFYEHNNNDFQKISKHKIISDIKVYYTIKDIQEIIAYRNEQLYNEMRPFVYDDSDDDSDDEININQVRDQLED